MLKHISLLLILVASVSSCSKSSDPVGPGSASYSAPKTGSTFSYDQYATDTTNAMPIASSRDTSVHTFLRTGITYAGKTNVSQILEKTRFSTDTTYINYETNGDISSYGSDGNGGMIWGTIPIGSKTTFSFTQADTTEVILGVTTRIKISVEVKYVSEETLSIKGQSINVTKLKQSFIVATTVGGVMKSKSADVFVYFAPSLGYIVKSDQPVQDGIFSSGKSKGHVMMLFDYTLK